MSDQKPDPTPEKIREMCELIRAEWSPAEERSRRAVPNLSPEVREVRTVASED